VFICDLEGRLVTANRAACEMLGYDLNELSGRLFTSGWRQDRAKSLEVVNAQGRENCTAV
jgi:PAS domain S-box-containing protein